MRDLTVNFRAVIEFAHGIYETLGEKNPPTIPMLMYGLGVLDEPTVSELADCCGLQLKTASRGIKELRKRAWVTLEGDKKDERKRRVKLTPAGAHVLKLVNGALVDVAFRVVENVMGTHPSNPNFALRKKGT